MSEAENDKLITIKKREKKRNKSTLLLYLDPDSGNNIRLGYQRCLCFCIQLSYFSQHHSVVASLQAVMRNGWLGPEGEFFQDKIQEKEASDVDNRAIPKFHGGPPIAKSLVARCAFSCQIYFFQDSYNHGFLNLLVVLWLFVCLFLLSFLLISFFAVQ